MNRFEIRDILNAHKEHFRVLPTNAMNDVFGIIKAVDIEIEASKVELTPEVEKPEPKVLPIAPMPAKKKAKKKKKK